MRVVCKENKIIQFVIKNLNLNQRSPEFRRSLRNVMYSAAGYLLLPILWLLATPTFVSRLGVDRYGIWMLVNTFLGFSGIMSFGLSDATIKYVSKYRALGEKWKLVRVIRSTLTIYGILGIFVGTVVFLCAPLLVYHVFKVGLENTTIAVVALRVGGIGIIVSFLDSVFQSTIYGYERYDLAAFVNMGTNVVSMMINLALILSGYGLVEILMVAITLLWISSIVKALIVKYALIPDLVFRPLFDKVTLKEIFSFGFYSWLHNISGILFHQVDRFLLASLLDTSALTYYTVCLQLSQQIHSILSRAVSFLFPLSVTINETGNLQRLRRVYFKGLNFTVTVAVAIGLPLFIFSPDILSLWMGRSFADQADVILRILTFAFTLLATSIVPYYYLNGTGFVRLNAFLGISSGIIVTIVSLLLIPYFGIVGAAWARLANIPIGFISRTIIHYKVLNDHRWFAGFIIFLPVIVTFIIGLCIITLLDKVVLSLHFLVIMSLVFAMIGAMITGIICYFLNNPKIIS
jgi:O-antigen/teichoic acid export membrane protein